MIRRVTFTISLPPRTKKNHQRIITNRATGRPMVMPSKEYKEYEENAMYFLKPLGIDYPVNVKAIYYMPTRRRVDLVNLHEALHDCLVKAGTITDDNSNIIVSTDGSRVRYDKENPRTEVTIEEAKDDTM